MGSFKGKGSVEVQNLLEGGVNVVAKKFDLTSEEYKLGQQIQKYRKALGLTQNQLADLLDMDRANIANYENGTKGEMGFRMLMKFSKALGVSTDTLLGLDEPQDELTEELTQLTEENRATVKSIMDGLLLKQKYSA